MWSRISSGISIQSTQVWLLFFTSRILGIFLIAITSLVTFPELCILLCFKVFVLNFNFRLISARHSVFPSSILLELSIIFNFTILHSISPFCTQFHRFALNFTFFALVKLHCSLLNWRVLSQSDCRNCCFYISIPGIIYSSFQQPAPTL